MASLGAAVPRIWALVLKELVQMRRDRITFAMMFAVPVMQLMLFGFAINTDPRQLPTAVHVEEQTPLVRSILQGLRHSDYYRLVSVSATPQAHERLLTRGEVAFVISIPAGFTAQLLRGEQPALYVQADASDPAASSSALAQAQHIITQALRHDLQRTPVAHLQPSPPAFELITHATYNPEAITQYNIVPGLLGVILTMTLVMITGMAMTREAERGNLENLLAMPARPFEVMVGKILPYVMVGAIQTVVVLLAARHLFQVPFDGALWVLLCGVGIFVLANLAVGFTFSTLVRSQLQAMQLTFFFFLPSLLLSGFMFPFRGMPAWAQTLGEVFPLTHFLRVVRGVMLKAAEFVDVRDELLAMALFTSVMMVIAMLRYRRTLD